MSSKSRRPTKKAAAERGGSWHPHQNRGISPEDLQDLSESFRQAARELRSFSKPLTVETYISTFLNHWREAIVSELHRDDPDELLIELINEQTVDPAVSEPLAQLHAGDTVALLNAIAAVTEPQFAQLARGGLTDPVLRDTEVPEWVPLVGGSQVRSCYTSDSEFGDETEIMLTYVYLNEAEHGLRVTVNHTLAGMATDVRVEPDVTEALDAMLEAAGSDSGRLLTRSEPASVHTMLEEAFGVTPQAEDPPVTVGYQNLRPFAIARIRALPPGSPSPEPPAWSEKARSNVVSEFLSAPEAAGLPAAAAEAIAAELVSYGVENDRGQPLRVSPTKLQVVLLGWLPRTGLLARSHGDHVPEVIPAWVRYTARRTGMSDKSLEKVLAALPDITGRFKEAYEDTERWSPERKAVERMLADVDPAADVDQVFARRMFALPRLPDREFDPEDEDSFIRLIAEEHADTEKTHYVAKSSDRSPRRHVTLHTMIARQLWKNDPPETWATAQRLAHQGLERHEVLHALAFAVSEQVARACGNKDAFDLDCYRAALAALPHSWRESADSAG
ncbi:hypothetical protein [Actinopolymorpha pittospori]